LPPKLEGKIWEAKLVSIQENTLGKYPKGIFLKVFTLSLGVTYVMSQHNASVFIRFRVIQPECLISFFVLVFQSCCGVFIQSLMTGLIFSKLARPKQRAHTIMFSRLAVVCKRDCEYQLLFRVGDMRRSHIIATSIRALMVKDR